MLLELFLDIIGDSQPRKNLLAPLNRISPHYITLDLTIPQKSEEPNNFARSNIKWKYLYQRPEMFSLPGEPQFSRDRTRMGYGSGFLAYGAVLGLASIAYTGLLVVPAEPPTLQPAVIEEFVGPPVPKPVTTTLETQDGYFLGTFNR